MNTDVETMVKIAKSPLGSTSEITTIVAQRSHRNRYVFGLIVSMTISPKIVCTKAKVKYYTNDEFVNSKEC